MGVLSVTGGAGHPVLFVHGNVSSSLFWQPTMLALPERYRPLAVDHAASVTLVAPVSPFGFGGTHGTDGTLCDPSGTGSGAGSVNPGFVARLAAGDRTGDGPTSPRQVLLAHYVKPPFVPAELDIFVESMLSTRIGDDHYPGTSRQALAWPGFAPGDRGVLNTMAPTHFRITGMATVEPKPPILWLRGADDVIVSDTSLYDLAYLGSIGAVPGWPGPGTWPPQPMVAQTRALLDGYAAAGGRYREMVIQDSGHGPHLDQPEQFRAALSEHLAEA